MEECRRGDKNGQIQIFKIYSIFEPLYFVALAFLQFKKFPLNLATFRQILRFWDLNHFEK